MKSQKTHFERQWQHSYDLMRQRTKKRIAEEKKKSDRKATMIGIVFSSTWLVWVLVAFFTR